MTNTLTHPPAEHDDMAPADAPERDAPDPSANEELVCTLCGLRSCWTARPPRPNKH
jgi:hypothetical protein